MKTKTPTRLVNLQGVERNDVAQKQFDELPKLAAVELERDGERSLTYIGERRLCKAWAKAWNRDELDLHKATGYRARVVKITYMIQAEGGAL